jgi:DNA-binding MarR family transcriptional regulator
MDGTGEQKLMDLPPSAKLVFWVVDREGPVTQKRIAEETLLPKRTVRYALGRLAETDAVTEETNLTDARQTLYSTSHRLSD